MSGMFSLQVLNVFIVNGSMFVMVGLVIALSYVIAVLAMANFIVLSYAPQSICTAPNAGVDCFRCNITDTLGPFVCIAIMQCA